MRGSTPACTNLIDLEHGGESLSSDQRCRRIRAHPLACAVSDQYPRIRRTGSPVLGRTERGTESRTSWMHISAGLFEAAIVLGHSGEHEQRTSGATLVAQVAADQVTTRAGR